MIDIHSHILPEIDDGSRNIEETIAMITEAYKNGITADLFRKLLKVSLSLPYIHTFEQKYQNQM